MDTMIEPFQGGYCDMIATNAARSPPEAIHPFAGRTSEKAVIASPGNYETCAPLHGLLEMPLQSFVELEVEGSENIPQRFRKSAVGCGLCVLVCPKQEERANSLFTRGCSSA